MNINRPKYTVVLLAPLMAAALLVSGCGSGESSLEAGIARLQENNYKSAARHLEKAVKLLPDSPAAHCNLGITCWKTGRHKEAIFCFRKAAQLSPDDPRPLEFLARVMMDMQNWNDARSALALADKRLPSSSRILTTMALVEINSGNNAQAISRLTQALDTDPTYAPALYNMAVIHRDRLNNREAAATFFNRYIKVAAGDPHVRDLPQFLNRTPPPAVTAQPPAAKPPKPQNSDPLVANAKKAIDAMELDRALDLLKQAIRKNPGDSNPQWELAALYDKNLNNPEKAIEAYGKFAQQFPGDPRVAAAQKRAAELQPLVKKPSGQPKTATAPVQAKPKDTAAAQEAFSKGYKCQKEQKWDESIAFYNEALTLDNTMSDAAYNLGFVYKEKNDLARSKQEFVRAVEMDPNSSKARYMLAVVHSMLNENKQAVEQLNRILRVDPDYAKAHLQMGSIMQAENDLSGAKEHFTKFLKLAPNDPVVKNVQEQLDIINKSLPAGR